MERTIVSGQSPREVARELELDALTIRELLVQAKAKFFKRLKDVRGRNEFELMMDAVSGTPDTLRIAFFMPRAQRRIGPTRRLE